MLRNYILVAFRNLMRNRTISLIHITSFGLGIAAFLFAAQTVIFEYSFDDFHKNGNRVFEIIATYSSTKGEFFRNTRIDPTIAPRINGTVPEIQHVARFYPQSGEEPYCVLSYTNINGEQKLFNEERAYYADENFLNIFEFPVVAGAPGNVLSDNTSLVMTQSTARKYFGDEDPIGKTLELTTGGTESNKTHYTYRVSTVLEDLPANSSFQFDLLLPFRNFEENYKQVINEQWGWFGSFHNFILLKDGKNDLASIEAKINQQFPEAARKHYATDGFTVQYHLQPLSKIHFDPDEARVNNDALLTSNKTFVLLVGLIGLSILVVAGVNYINLTTAKALKRAKEVGIRKVAGASRFQLVKQFMLDAVVFNIIGLLLAFTLLQFVKPLLVVWLGMGNTQVGWWSWHSVIILVILIGSTLVSGLVPAIMLTGVQPVVALKGKITRSPHGGLMRKSLVVLQFGVSVALIVFTSVVLAQLGHMRSKDAGFDSNQRVVIRAQGTEDFDLKKFRTFRERILTNPKVINATASMGVPGRARLVGSNFDHPLRPGENVFMGLAVVDYDFASTMGIKLIAGREFREDQQTDERVMMLDESAVRYLGFDSPEDVIGQSITWRWVEGDMTLKVIGVIGNWNILSPRELLFRTAIFFANTAHPYPKYTYYTVHLASGAIKEGIGVLEKEWKAIFPKAPFEYFFLDESFQSVFQQEEKMQSLASVATLLAIFIACLGLGGLIAYSVTQRTKEIGIRKTLGASVTRILVLLSRDFIRLILIATVIAIPMVWWAVKEFLSGYAYRIEISAWMFIIPSLVLLLIAIGTMSFQTIKAASANPVESLKYE